MVNRLRLLKAAFGFDTFGDIHHDRADGFWFAIGIIEDVEFSADAANFASAVIKTKILLKGCQLWHLSEITFKHFSVGFVDVFQPQAGLLGEFRCRLAVDSLGGFVAIKTVCFRQAKKQNARLPTNSRRPEA